MWVVIYGIILFSFFGSSLLFKGIYGMNMITQLDISGKHQTGSITRIISNRRSTFKIVYFKVDANNDREYKIIIHKTFFNGDSGDIVKVIFNKPGDFWVIPKYINGSRNYYLFLIKGSGLFWASAIILLVIHCCLKHEHRDD
jgi:hypothetical protein